MNEKESPSFCKKLKTNLRRFYIRHFRPSLYRKEVYRSISLSSSLSFSEKSLPLDYFSWKESESLIAVNCNNDKVIIWFAPYWTNVWGGGHYTIFRFANHFAKYGFRNILYIYNDDRSFKSSSQLELELAKALPECRLEVIKDSSMLPRCSAAIATTWQSAYYVRAFPFAKRKFYFMQDYESQFYPYGTSSLQAMNSYTFGFYGITGGEWLKNTYIKFGGEAISYQFSTDREVFFPNKEQIVRDRVQKLFFYGRPSTERRCYDLGIESLKMISSNFPDVDIIIAGMDLENPPSIKKATLLGNLSLNETAEIYRSCDVGLAFSGTNLSYLPVELMASGCPVITNKGEQVEWYCDKENSMLVDPVPSEVLKAFTMLYESKELRYRIATNGFEKSKATTWEAEMDKIFEYIRRKLG